MKELDVRELNLDPINVLHTDWMLVSAGTEDNWNTMTASWGHFGCIWGKNMPTAVIYVRPQRYTHDYVEREECFTLTFFDQEYHNDLSYLGCHSGRDEDKVAKTKLTPEFIDGQPSFKEARLTLICRKIYRSELKEENFLDKAVMDKAYPKRDFHTVYVGEVVKAYVPD